MSTATRYETTIGRARPSNWTSLLGGLLVLVSLLATLSWTGTRAQEEKRTEYDFKASFLLKFCNYVDWPEAKFPTKETAYVIGVLGSNPFGTKLKKAVEGRRIGSRAIRVEYPKGLEGIERCHVLFVPASWKGDLRALAGKAGKNHVLLVGEAKGFALRGGVINFYTEESKLCFEVNVAAAKRAGLAISSKLLRSARIVREKG